MYINAYQYFKNKDKWLYKDILQIYVIELSTLCIGIFVNTNINVKYILT